MELLKKHYEKVVLGAVLLGLTIGACLLPIIISAKRKALDDLRTINVPKPKPLPPLDLALEEAALQRVQTPIQLDFTTRHNTLNPVLWKKFPDGHLQKEVTGNEEGADALVITEIRPLYLQIAYDAPSGNGYKINIDRQAEPRESRRQKQVYVSKESKSDLLTLHDVKGPADKPTALALEWNETSEPFDLVADKDKPFKRVEAYEADLKYPLENKTWARKRKGMQLVFAGGAYNIVAITQSNVVVLAESNKKKTTITFRPATESR